MQFVIVAVQVTTILTSVSSEGLLIIKGVGICTDTVRWCGRKTSTFLDVQMIRNVHILEVLVLNLHKHMFHNPVKSLLAV